MGCCGEDLTPEVKKIILDLSNNIIENVWRILKIRLKRSLETIRNRDDLVREVLRIWESLTVPYVRDLYYTIP
jgi:hypothetical protein